MLHDISRSAFTAFFVGAAIAGSAIAQDKARTLEQSPSRALEQVTPQLKLEAMKPVGAVVDCAVLAEGLWGWVNENHGGGEGAHRIGAKMASVKIRERDGSVYPWGHGAYSEGAFGWSGDKLVGRFTVLFSDRKSGAGARFDKAQTDIEDITLYKDGRVEIMLRSWGNTVLKLEESRCYSDGFLTGLKHEGNGVSLVSFALRREVMTPDSHPAVLWP